MKAYKAIIIDVFEEDRFLNRFSFSTESISIGRHPNCDIFVSHSTVSRKHALITYEGNQWFITNKSPNGVYYQGKKIDQQKIKQDDDFQVGPFKLLVKKIVASDSTAYKVFDDDGTFIEFGDS